MFFNRNLLKDFCNMVFGHFYNVDFCQMRQCTVCSLLFLLYVWLWVQILWFFFFSLSSNPVILFFLSVPSLEYVQTLLAVESKAVNPRYKLLPNFKNNSIGYSYLFSSNEYYVIAKKCVIYLYLAKQYHLWLFALILRSKKVF